MKNEKDCKIIEDLLPNYIDGLTNNITNEYIEKHLKECNSCQIRLANMKNQIYAKENDSNEEIKTIKKFMLKHKILKITLIVILVLILLLVGRVLYINSVISKTFNNTSLNLSNMYQKIIEKNNTETITTEFYYTDNAFQKIISKIKNGDENNYYAFQVYVTPNESFELDLNKNTMRKILNNRFSSTIVDINYFRDFFTCKGMKIALILQNIFKNTSIKYDGKDCFELFIEDRYYIIEKETGLILKDVNSSTNTIKTYTYKFNNIKIDMPDISNYKLLS